jgi:hypothetical protein
MTIPKEIETAPIREAAVNAKTQEAPNVTV